MAYSSSIKNESFWFSEFSYLIGEINSGSSIKELKKIDNQTQIFTSVSSNRSKEMVHLLGRRINKLPDSIALLYNDLSVDNQLLVNLIGVMLNHQLLFDFIYEIYREQLIIGSNQISSQDIRYFKENKKIQNEKIAKWSNKTFQTTITQYTRFLKEARLMEQEGNICKPVMDYRLVEELKANDLIIVWVALNGVKEW
ncbi:BrxA family protein [Carnobacterium sp. PL17RED31]|uniref:BrxA family protein n=1 Tax=Aerococcus viridans TaxID=1377 RepID=UPI0012568CE0|nr:DUF1819 family protein [Carnobacterium sp. PL17RED31]